MKVVERVIKNIGYVPENQFLIDLFKIDCETHYIYVDVFRASDGWCIYVASGLKSDFAGSTHFKIHVVSHAREYRFLLEKSRV